MWDWESQRSETRTVIADLLLKPEVYLGMKIHLDVQTVDDGNGNARSYMDALTKAGLDHEAYDGDEGHPETIEVTFRDAEFRFESIWEREERVTKLCLRFGFVPDGMGLLQSRRGRRMIAGTSSRCSLTHTGPVLEVIYDLYEEERAMRIEVDTAPRRI